MLPKGHIEKNEQPAEAALREVAEEAGVKARIIGTAGYEGYVMNDESVYVKYYLMVHLTDGKIKTKEPRQQRWCTFEEAISLLSFEDSRQLLRFAQCRLAEHVGQTAGSL